jgi:hypothetical protein
MWSDSRTVLAVIGGGFFGSYHTRQLLKAIRSGQLAGERIVVVDRSTSCTAAAEFAGCAEVSVVESDWQGFLRSWLPGAAGSDHLVPAPLAPHLTWSWLSGELAASAAPAPRGWNLPYEVPGADGAVYLSAAGWMCPATCVEPAHCPALHAPRDWDLAGMIESGASERGYVPAVFRCVHLANGVSAIAAGELQAARQRLADADGSAEALVATSSRCHAAIGALRFGPRR